MLMFFFLSLVLFRGTFLSVTKLIRATIAYSFIRLHAICTLKRRGLPLLPTMLDGFVSFLSLFACSLAALDLFHFPFVLLVCLFVCLLM